MEYNKERVRGKGVCARVQADEKRGGGVGIHKCESNGSALVSVGPRNQAGERGFGDKLSKINLINLHGHSETPSLRQLTAAAGIVLKLPRRDHESKRASDSDSDSFRVVDE